MAFHQIFLLFSLVSLGIMQVAPAPAVDTADSSEDDRERNTISLRVIPIINNSKRKYELSRHAKVFIPEGNPIMHLNDNHIDTVSPMDLTSDQIYSDDEYQSYVAKSTEPCLKGEFEETFRQGTSCERTCGSIKPKSLECPVYYGNPKICLCKSGLFRHGERECVAACPSCPANSHYKLVSEPREECLNMCNQPTIFYCEVKKVCKYPHCNCDDDHVWNENFTMCVPKKNCDIHYEFPKKCTPDEYAEE